MTTALATTEFPALPALKGLGRLADLRPVICVDSREQQALTFTRLESVVATLQSADYSFLGAEERFAVSRKSLPDLVSSCVGETPSSEMTPSAAESVALDAYKDLLAGPMPTHLKAYRRAIIQAVLIGRTLEAECIPSPNPEPSDAIPC
jgi:hypothetical protein